MGLTTGSGSVMVAFAVFGLLIALAAAYFWYENGNLRLQLAQTTGQRDSVQQEAARLQIALQQKTDELKGTTDALIQAQNDLARTQNALNRTQLQLQQSQQRLQDAADILAQQRAELQSLQQNLSGMTQTIDDSIQWFRDNAQLPPPSLLPSDQVRLWARAFDRSVHNDCIQNGVLHLACVPLMMERKLAFTYRTEREDRLASLPEIYFKNGGDCEDYSLFLKAVINSLKQEDPALDVEAWKPESGGRYSIYTDSSGDEWYYPDAAGRTLGKLDGLSPYVICYTTRYDAEAFEGHCIVALAKAGITNAARLDALNEAATFEPQNGEYTGWIGETEGRQLCGNGQWNCETEINRISLIISDDDLYAFQEGHWRSYHQQLEEADKIEKEIGIYLNATTGP